MKVSQRQLLISIVALAVALVTVIYMARNPVLLGFQPLVIRSAYLSLAIIAAMVAVYPFNPLFSERPGAYALVVCLPALLPGLFYFFLFLPQQAGSGLSGQHLESNLITDQSSSGIVEIGFSYPIYAPTLSIINHELYSREVNVFLRMIDANNEAVLYRAVRAQVPGNSLSVEASVRGLLIENAGYLFLPIAIPPLSETEGRVVFVISNLDDGITFSEAVERASSVQVELRDPQTGELLLEFPMDHF